MRTLFLFAFLISCFTISSAQTAEEKADNISLFVGVVPGSNKQLNDQQREKLENKVRQCASRSGVVNIGMSSFLLNPQLDVDEINMVQGLKNIVTTKCELVLTISRTDYKQFPGQSFGSLSMRITGSGTDTAQAISNAVQQINTSDPRIKDFIVTTKAKILDYYVQHCDEVIKEARRHYELQQHGLSIGLLFSVPVSAPCYDEARKMSISVYKEFLKDECETQLLQLKSILVTTKSTGAASNSAQNKYDKALKLIADMNPAAECYPEAYGMIKKLESDLDEEQRKRWDLTEKAVTGSLDAQKAAYEAMGKVAASQNPMGGTTVVIAK